MTTLVGLHLEGRGTWIAADQMVSGDGIKSGPVQKWTLGPGGYAIGAAGSARTLNLLDDEGDRLMRGNPTPGQVVMRLRAALEHYGFAPGIPGGVGPQIWGQNIILASPVGLWALDQSFFIWPIQSGQLWADGSGRDFAIGAGHMTRDHEDPAYRVVSAVEAASTYDENSGMGVFVHHLTPAQIAPKPVKKLTKPVKKLTKKSGTTKASVVK